MSHPSLVVRYSPIALCGLLAAAGCFGSAGPAPEVEPADQAGELDPSRTAFVQLFEWKWTDVARECETFLGPKGFAAVQISPPGEHAWVTSGDGAPFPWWMRYQPVSYRLDRSRSGTRAELIAMVNRCRAVGVAIYVDAVINHMAPGAGGTSSAGASTWGGGSFPRVPYGLTDFHDPACGITNYNDANNVQRCSLSGLPDLDSGSTYVRGKIADYLVDLAAIGVQGFRVDAAKHIHPADLGAIVNAVNARAGRPLFWFLEVIGAAGEAVQPNQYFGLSGNQVSVTEFAFGPQLFGKFAGGGRLADLRTFGETWGLLPSARAIVFTDNHDKQRGHGGGGNYLTYHNGSTYDLANVFMLAWPYGTPVVMSSYAFHTVTNFDTSHGPPFVAGTGATRGAWDGGVSQPACFDQAIGGWVCEHRFRPIGNMVGFRNATAAHQAVTDWTDNGANQIAFGRGDRGFVVINKEAAAVNRSFHTSMAAGRYCNIVSGEFTAATATAAASCTGDVVTIDAAGNGAFTATAFGAAAIHVNARLDATPPAPTPVAVTFNQAADTHLGQSVYLVGSIAQLASWNPAAAVPLTRISGTGTRGNWRATVDLPASTAVEYKYVIKDGAGNVTWESGANRALTTGAGGTTQTVNDAWK
jgi:alpha-amylase